MIKIWLITVTRHVDGLDVKIKSHVRCVEGRVRTSYGFCKGVGVWQYLNGLYSFPVLSASCQPLLLLHFFQDYFNRWVPLNWCEKCTSKYGWSIWIHVKNEWYTYITIITHVLTNVDSNNNLSTSSLIIINSCPVPWKKERKNSVFFTIPINFFFLCEMVILLLLYVVHLLCFFSFALDL